METIVIKTEGKKLQALISVLAALDIPFLKEESKPVSKKMLEKIENAHKEYLTGETVRVNPRNIWESI